MDAITPAPLPPAPPNAGVDREVYCPACHYNLFGTVSGRCPECGLAFDVATLCESQIPWVHRKKIGWWKAYWRTVWRVLFSPRKFAREVCRPVNFADANRFRWVNIWLAWACAIVPVTEIARVLEHNVSVGQMPGIFGMISILLAWQAGWLLFLLAASAIPADWCAGSHLSDQQRQRAKAISFYATAPLILTILVTANCGLIILVKATHQSITVGVSLLLAVFFFMILELFWVWLVSICVFSRSTQASPIQSWPFAILLPLTWLLYGLLFLVGLPAAVLYLVLMVQSVM